MRRRGAIWSTLRDRASTRDLLDTTTESGSPIFVSAVTLVELRYLVEKGTLRESDLDAIREVVEVPGSAFAVAALHKAVAWAVGEVLGRRWPTRGTG